MLPPMEATAPESVFIFGCGYVGGALADSLLADGARVGALTRNPETAATLRSRGLSEVVEAEIDSDTWHTAIHGNYSCVVNCVSSAGGGLEGYRRSYLEGQRSVLAWAEGRHIERYLFTGSTSVYPQDGGVAVDEAASSEGAPSTGRILLESERLLAERGERFKRWFIFRLAGIYGPGRHYLLDQVCKGGDSIPGRGDYTLNMVRLEDIVGALRCALNPEVEAPSGIYNIADDAPSTKAEIVSWVARTMGRPEPHFDPSVVSPRLARRGGHMPDRRILNGKAKRAFGWELRYPDFRSGYRELVTNYCG